MSGRERGNAAPSRIAYEAARIMTEQGEPDFDRARRKAAARIGVLDRRSWPSNEAIQEAVATQRRLFVDGAQARDLRRLRRDALAAMRSFKAFSPHLIGPVLHGSGHAEQGVQLCLYAERPEDVVFALMDQHIPWHERERSFRYSDGARRTHPALRFLAGGTPIELVVLPRHALRNPPLDPVTERPARGVDSAELERLMSGGDDQ
ncbi:hypothetical protein [uncultured Thiodictyon sp.]|uniref:hypothetical protein n=1 Tax=uncultured Thiodictyon sp. TaxID=1846217 RepID=UPI0025DA891F|nr:hypothetical protein [uncultured Thiodictyon sp.]